MAGGFGSGVAGSVEAGQRVALVAMGDAPARGPGAEQLSGLARP